MVSERVAAAEEDGERDAVAHQQQPHGVIQRGAHNQVRVDDAIQTALVSSVFHRPLLPRYKIICS